MTDASQGVLHPLAVFGLVPEKETLLGEFFLFRFGAKNGFQSVRVVARIIDFGGQCHRGGRKVLNLFEFEVKFLGFKHQLGQTAGKEFGPYQNRNSLPSIMALITKSV